MDVAAQCKYLLIRSVTTWGDLIATPRRPSKHMRNTARSSGRPPENISLSASECIKRASSPRANNAAVWFRTSLIGVFGQSLRTSPTSLRAFATMGWRCVEEPPHKRPRQLQTEGQEAQATAKRMTILWTSSWSPCRRRKEAPQFDRRTFRTR